MKYNKQNCNNYNNNNYNNLMLLSLGKISLITFIYYLSYKYYEGLFIILCIFFDLYCMYKYSEYTKKCKRVPLHDIVHHKTLFLYNHLTRKQKYGLKIFKDMMCFFPLIISLFICPFNYVWSYFKLYAYSHLLRPIFFISTRLPRTNSRKKINSIIGCFNGGNHDLIYSGHAIGLYLCCYGLQNYFPVWICYSYGFIISFLILFLREHYTVDLLVSLLVTNLLITYK